jgi:hypothetical protein
MPRPAHAVRAVTWCARAVTETFERFTLKLPDPSSFGLILHRPVAIRVATQATHSYSDASLMCLALRLTGSSVRTASTSARRSAADTSVPGKFLPPCASTLWRNSIAAVAGPAVRLLHGGTAPNLSMRFVSAQFCAQTGRRRASCQLKTSRQAIQQLRPHFVAV